MNSIRAHAEVWQSSKDGQAEGVGVIGPVCLPGAGARAVIKISGAMRAEENKCHMKETCYGVSVLTDKQVWGQHGKHMSRAWLQLFSAL